LYRDRDVESDGALGWAPDFSIETAAQVVTTLLGAWPSEIRNSLQQRLLKAFAEKCPDWMDMLRRCLGDPADASP